MGGGPGTPALAAAVSNAGGLGFLAAGYKTADAVRREIRELRDMTDRPFGVNLFVPSEPADPALVERYAETLRPEAERYGASPGEPRHDDDGWEDKLAVMAEERVPLVSFTFGCPPAAIFEQLDQAWATVTTPGEAAIAEEAGADALVLQGVEAGAHHGSFTDEDAGGLGLLALLQLVRTELPLVASGGLMTRSAVAAVLAAGASAAQLGTAFLLAPEAGTSEAHRVALGGVAETALTRAFTGRTARGIVNRFMREHGADAPRAYPEVHNLTAPLRAAAREAGDPEAVNLWAGQGYPLARELPAAELVRELSPRSGPSAPPGASTAPAASRP
jgi:nitronate monooxygenase